MTLLKEVVKVNKQWIGKAGIAIGGVLVGAVLASIGAKQQQTEELDQEFVYDEQETYESEIIDIQPEEEE